MPGPKLIRPAQTSRQAVEDDDWTNDPSFDLALGDQVGALSSSSSRRHITLPSDASRTGTIKARQAKQQPAKHVEGDFGQDDREDDLDFDFDLNDKPTLKSDAKAKGPRTPTSSTGASARKVPQTVVGQGPGGVGVITRLGSGKTSAPRSPTSVKLAANTVADAWEADLDFDDDPSATLKLGSKQVKRAGLSASHPPRRQQVMPDADDLDDLGFDLDDADAGAGHAAVKQFKRSGQSRLGPPPRQRIMPDANALDDLGFDLDDNEATLKASNTLKAMLPPPRTKKPAAALPPPDDDFEGDLVLPLNMQNLSLVPPATKLKPRPRVSDASTLNTDWDSPTTSTSGHKSGAGGHSWSSESQHGKRASDTSATSVNVATPHFKRQSYADDSGDSLLDGEDMESGLVLPTETFFSEKRAKELNSILDRKRKPQFAPPPALQARTGTPRAADESMEDGLLLDDPKTEISNSRLRHQKRSRHAHQTGTYPPKGLRSADPPVACPSAPTRGGEGEDRAWQKQRERGWGRHTPLPSAIKDRPSQHGPGTTPSTGARSHSASAMSTLNAFAAGTPPRQRDLAAMRDVSHPTPSSRLPPSQTRLSAATPAIPLPPVPATPSSSNRLRHQKSYHHLSSNTLQSPSLPKKQSLASLRDAFAKPADEYPTLTSPPPTLKYYHNNNNTASRLTAPTSASRAKAKTPISQIFPEHYYANVRNAAAGSATPTPSAPRVAKPTTAPRTAARLMDHPRRTKVYGDGSELDGIDDLVVEQAAATRSSPIGLGRPSRRGVPEPARPATKPTEPDHRKTSGPGAGSAKRRSRKPAMLIKHLGAVEKRKVVGEMTWNPDTLRWEGNEAVLRDFDSIPTAASARPALITHLGGSAPGSSSSGSAAGLTGTIKIVGDMRFDPEKMCWVSLGEEEPDPFEGLADDEEEDDRGGATITRASGRKLMAVGLSSSSSASVWSSSRLASESSTFSAATTSSAASGSSSSGAWDECIRIDFPKELLAECKEAEERHKREMKGWLPRTGSKLKDGALSREEAKDRERREEKRLWEIRHLALRS